MLKHVLSWIALFLLLQSVLSESKTVKLAAQLTVAQVTPAVDNGTVISNGIALFFFDEDSKSLNWTITHDVDGNLKGAIHGPAPRGASAPSIFDLESLDKNPITGKHELNSKQVEYLLNGTLYIQFSNEEFPNGIVRGQIEQGPDEYEIILNGDSMVPKVTTNATGEGVLTLNRKSSTLTYNLNHGVRQAGAASIHGPADKDEKGDRLFNLTSIGTNQFQGTITLNSKQVDYLDDGQLYIVITSQQHPDGEIRGHVIPVGDSDSSDGLSGGAIAAIVIIVVLAALVLIGLFVGVMLKRRKKHRFEVVEERQTGGYVPPNF